MSIYNTHPHSAAAISQIAEYGKELERAKRQSEQRKNQIMTNIESDIKSQKISQDGMALALFELVKIQNESNKIIQTQCDELKRQNELLQKQNISQTKELKKQRIWNWITYGITTVIAIASVVGTFISAFK